MSHQTFPSYDSTPTCCPCARTLRKAERWLLAVAVTCPFAGNLAQAQQPPPRPELTFKAADPNEKGDGTLSPVALRAITHGPLQMGQADIDAKAVANKSSDEALRFQHEILPSVRSSSDGVSEDEAIQLNLSVSGSINIAGQSDPSATPPDTTGAIGILRFIQLINKRAGLFDATNGNLLVSGTLDDLAGNFGSAKADPQIIWDMTSFRFYYVMLEVFSAADNRLAFGFSKGPLPTDLSDAWCHYEIGFGPSVPDAPKLGDSQDFALIGANTFFPSFIGNGGFQGQFAGADLIAISKPSPGTATCQPASSFNFGAALNLLDSNRSQVFGPAPANQIYGFPDPSHPPAPTAGFVIARNGSTPSNALWLFNVTKSANGNPIFGRARRLTVNSYDVPPDANQQSDRKLDTLDARMTQAVQAFRPLRGTHSLWTQQTIKSPVNPSLSVVQVYEIDPVPSTPVVLGSVFIFSSVASLFNGAISPDRQAFGAVENFGDSWILEYNSSGSTRFPFISAASSANGGPLRFTTLVKSGGPYTDFNNLPEPWRHMPLGRLFWGEPGSLPG